jgi:hypothetical protein
LAERATPKSSRRVFHLGSGPARVAKLDHNGASLFAATAA